MKRWLGVLLLLTLLSGCADTSPQDPTQATQAQTQPATQPPTDPGLYDPENVIESQTACAVKAYTPDLSGCTGIMTMGEDLLLFEKDRLTLLTGEHLTEFTSVEISGLPMPDSGLVQVRPDGVAYYDKTAKSVVFLTSNLRENIRLHLPEDIRSGAWLAPDWATVYYCTDSDIRVLDMKTGVSRLLKEQGAAKHTITGILLEGTALRCNVQLADGTVKTVLISTETGELLHEGAYLSSMVTWDDRYFLQQEESIVPELIFGDTQSEPKVIWPTGYGETHWVLPERNSIVTLQTEQGAARLDCYSLDSGLRTGSVRLEGLEQISSVAGTAGGTVWLRSGDTLYRWQPEKSPTEDAAIYTMHRYTREQPDEVGLSVAQKTAKTLEKRYQVELLLWNEAQTVVPWDYSFETEYLPRAYEKAFTILDSVMQNFPESFFTQAAERSVNGKLTIVLVRGIYGAAEKGTLASAGGIQYWLDENMYIALSLGQELERYFYHEMGHVIDTRVLSTSTAFYEWEKLNPPGFQYDNDYIANQNRQDEQYLRSADRWFIDMYSMSFAIEDRSRILEYASLPGNEAYFTSATMQAKLQRVCTGIRQAFGLEGDSRSFVWEQYLIK